MEQQLLKKKWFHFVLMLTLICSLCFPGIGMAAKPTAIPAPALTALATPGQADQTTRVIAMAEAGNHLAIEVSKKPINTPNVGDKAPKNGNGVINPYTVFSDIGGVDTDSNKYIGVYEADRTNKIVKFGQIILVPGMVKSESAPILNAAVAPGEATGSTSLQLVDTLYKNSSLLVKISNAALPAPKLGEKQVTTGAGTIFPYEVGTDILGVDAVSNKHLTVYEVNNKKQVLRYRAFVLTDADIKNAEVPNEDEWTLVFNDEFDGTAIDRTKWTFDIGNGAPENPGWGNNELEYYTDRTDNAKVENGKLVITAKKENYEGFQYTSAKLKSAGLFSKKYGKFEIKAKLPTGKGLWPAIWMMPQDSVYGTWAASGEIDIMEAWGSKPDRVAGTIHYGGNYPNNVYTGKEYHFADGVTTADEHVYTLEWEPGELRWYVDGELYSTQNDWYTKGLNQPANYTYPAPFDQRFYMIMNLAVGGNFDGNPDAATPFPSSMEVDYVRVYELTGRPYREPVPPVIAPEPMPADARPALPDGNLVYNENFDQDLPDVTGIEGTPNSDYWSLFQGEGGVGNVTIDNLGGDNYAKMNITSAGTQSYSVQLLHQVPLGKGRYYKLSFDAKAAAARSITVKLTAGAGRGFVAYSQNETFNLKSDLQHYELVFQMKQESDTAARIEFNAGLNTNAVWVGNVRLEETSGIAIDEDAPKLPLSGSGNHVYNGTFDQGGLSRMIYWHFGTSGAAAATASVDEPTRKLTVSASNGGTSADAVRLSQKGIQLIQDQQYKLTFDSSAGSDRTIEVKLLSKDGATTYASQSVALTSSVGMKTVEFTMTAATDPEAQIAFDFGGAAGSATLDNVLLVRTSAYIDPNTVLFPLKNGDFEAGMAPWQHINVDGASVASIDGGEAKIAVTSEGGVPWGILFMEDGLQLSNGVDYVLEFDASSSVARQIQVVLENASFTRFFDQKSALSNGMTHFRYEFKMTKDETVALKFLLGKLDGASAIGVHDIRIDNVKLEVKDARFLASKLTNGTFKNDAFGWLSYFADFAGVTGQMTAEGGELKVALSGSGAEFWHAQIEQENITLQKGKSYELRFDARSSVPRKFTAIVEHKGGDYKKYLNETAELGTTMKTYTYTFDMKDDTDAGAHVDFALGTVAGEAASGAHDVYFDNITLIEYDTPPAPPTGELVNGTFDTDASGWLTYLADGSNAVIIAEGGELKVDFPNYDGWFQWSTQVYQAGLKLEPGKTYELKFDARSTMAKSVLVELLKGTSGHHLPTQPVALTTSMQTFTYQFTAGEADANAKLAFLLGSNNVPGESFVTHSIFLDNISLTEKAVTGPAATIVNGTFDSDVNGWHTYIADGSDASVTSEAGEMKVNFTNYDGWFQWSTQAYQSGIVLEAGKTYELKFDARSTLAKSVLVELLKGAGGHHLPASAFALTASMQTFTFEFTAVAADTNAKLAFLLGSNNVPGESFVAHSIFIDNVSLAEKAAPVGTADTLYLTNSSGSRALSSAAGSGEAFDLIPTAAGGNYFDAPHNPIVFEKDMLNGTYNGGGSKTEYQLYFTTSGDTVGTAVLVQVSYDFNGDGTWDRVEKSPTYALDPVASTWEAFTQNDRGTVTIVTAGAYADFVNGKVKVEIWSQLGSEDLKVKVNSPSDASRIMIPFTF